MLLHNFRAPRSSEAARFVREHYLGEWGSYPATTPKATYSQHSTYLVTTAAAVNRPFPPQSMATKGSEDQDLTLLEEFLARNTIDREDLGEPPLADS